MTPAPDVTHDIPRPQNASSTSTSQHRTTSYTTPGSTNRYSIGSNETGESSTAASRRSVASSTGDVVDKMPEKDDSLEVVSTHTNGRGSYRSHRNRNSGGFLLSSSAFDSPAMDTGDASQPLHRRQSSREEKGKTTTRILEKGHTKRRSNTGLGLGVRSSPLASTVTTAETESGAKEATVVNHNENAQEHKSTRLDVDSTQIVNLALNLSESRRAVARRSISGASPPVGTGFRDSFAGGSLRQHLQQQRRISRNPSPKAERPDRSLSGSYRNVPNQKPHSPLNLIEAQLPEDYQYTFSPSTLARAEKAKNYIGLMVEYRRLLQYVPPLKPHGPERYAPSDSPLGSRFTSPRAQDGPAYVPRPLGREYNPLQYIRNRKVRARERKAIDGEAQGFGDLTKVSSWVHDVAAKAVSDDYRMADILPMPSFSRAADAAASPHTPPQSKSQAATPKIKRPRIDWVTNPADLLADVFWLEQDDNKKIIEDHSGRKIFAGAAELKRPVSHQGEELEYQKPTDLTKVGSPNLRIDTKLPEFSHTKTDSAKHRERATSRAKQKLREVTRLHHGHNGSVREHQLLKARLLSDTDSSDTDGARHPRRRSRRQTAETLEPATDILEKQMMEMLEKESAGQEWNIQDHSPEQNPPIPKNNLPRNGSRRHTRSTSLAADTLQNQTSIMRSPSGRPSLEAPSANPRTSLEELDSTAPNSPQTKAIKAAAFVPSIAMDLSPPQQLTSPSRHHLSRVRSKINPFHEHGRTHSRGRTDTIETPTSAPSIPTHDAVVDKPDVSHQRKRSPSPVAKISTRKTDDSSKSTGRSNVRRGKGGEESSSIIGFLKGTRGPVAKVSEFLWKKEPVPTLSVPPGFSSDESDSEILRAMRSKAELNSRDTSAEPPDGISDGVADKQSPLRSEKLPVFVSSHEPRGRSTGVENGNMAKDLRSERQAREERRNAARHNFLEIPPRIDVQNPSPSSSPDLEPARRYSTISDLESRRGSAFSGVESADARLNAILGQPGHPGTALPVTGLSALETTHGKRPALDGKRQWSISDRELPGHQGPVTKKEIARIRALLFSSGIKAKELSRQSVETIDLQDARNSRFSDVAKLSQDKPMTVPSSQQHILAARIIANDVQLSSRMWQSNADNFYNATVSSLLNHANQLHSSIVDNLTPKVRTAADEADEVSRNILTFQSLQIKRIIDTMDNMTRRRRRRFRWLRRGGWVLVEWTLVGVMWFAWFLVVFVRIVLGLGKGAVRSVRWLFWL